jgi:hypothetical protein
MFCVTFVPCREIEFVSSILFRRTQISPLPRRLQLPQDADATQRFTLVILQTDNKHIRSNVYPLLRMFTANVQNYRIYIFTDVVLLIKPADNIRSPKSFTRIPTGLKDTFASSPPWISLVSPGEYLQIVHQR